MILKFNIQIQQKLQTNIWSSDMLRSVSQCTDMQHITYFKAFHNDILSGTYSRLIVERAGNTRFTRLVFECHFLTSFHYKNTHNFILH